MRNRSGVCFNLKVLYVASPVYARRLQRRATGLGWPLLRDPSGKRRTNQRFEQEINRLWEQKLVSSFLNFF